MVEGGTNVQAVDIMDVPCEGQLPFSDRGGKIQVVLMCLWHHGAVG